MNLSSEQQPGTQGQKQMNLLAPFQPGAHLSRPTSLAFLVVTAVLWSWAGVLIKLVDWNPAAIAGMRSGIAALFMLAVIKKPKFTWSRAQIGGAIAYVFTVLLFITANKMTTAANAILLQYTAPVYVALFSGWFLKEKPRKADWAVIFVTLLGMVLFFLDRLTPGNIAGNIFAILSGISMAAMVLFLRIQKDGSPMESTLLGNILTFIIGLPFMIGLPFFHGPYPDAGGWLGLLLLGIFQLGMAYIFYTAAIPGVSAMEAILIPMLEPVLNPIWVALIMGELPGKWALLGGMIVLASVAFRCIWAVWKPVTGDKAVSQGKP